MAEYDFHFTSEVMDGIFGEVIDARGAWDTLGERLDNMEQGTGDTYTKAEVDTMLFEKVDKVTGKDLSTNDFTNAEKEKLAAIEEQANKTVIDNALSSTSTNPVQNKAVQASLARLVDAGAKNLANFKFAGVVPNVNVKPGTIVCTENNGTFEFSGAADDKNYAAYMLKQYQVKAGKYIVSGVSGGSNTTYWMRLGTGANDAYLLNLYDGTRELNLDTDTLITVQFVIYANQTVSNLVITPMLCTEEDYKISPEFVPYAPTNRELYEMILALQSGT